MAREVGPQPGEVIPRSSVRIRVEAALGTRQEMKPVYDAGGTLEVAGVLSFQACSETVCWPPQDVAVTWALRLLPPDLDRSPEPLQYGKADTPQRLSSGIIFASFCRSFT